MFEGWFDRPFGPEWNPLRHLGALSFFFFWIVAASGIYIYIFFETSVSGAYQSVAQITHDQWYFGGVMRSFHRYASDAMVVTVILHMVREFVMDRYRGVRWFTWITGVPILWLLYASGIGGYWLVWDQLAQYLIIASAEWLDWLGIFGEPLANNFLTRGSLGDRLFSLLLFLHIAFPLFLLFASWIHLVKVSRPSVNPPKGLALGTLGMLLILSLIKPAVSMAPADLGAVPQSIDLDWFFALFYPLYDSWGAGILWALAVLVSVFLSVLPWLPKFKPRAAAEVDLDNCNGCSRCYVDCPFSAVTMQPRTDGRPYPRAAVVDPDLCTACGICVGACPTATPFRSADMLVTGIDLPDYRLTNLRAETDRALARLDDNLPGGMSRIVVFGCEFGINVEQVETANAVVAQLPCIGMLPPSFIDYILTRRKADGVMLTGCREGDCFHRFGIHWTEGRLAGTRDPYLRKRVPRERVRIFWGAVTDSAKLGREIADFETALAALESTPPPAGEDSAAEGTAP
ncbi:MAG: cytochrome b N-terminal domain-containing protein [Rhodospirillales bacterium]|nr:cytochrome b N-terminal domain-containing protein [Rhodospirillales bacterium]MDP6645110.1 cytochrome b N-terminal domain-containing protein [Rhodospirillales bacterium]MDP6843670.1 cytochrome b N-terminal domain-containing protein [Rhodospirillales bacterium]